MPIHICFGTGVMIQGTNGTLVPHANNGGANINLVLVESHGTGRTDNMRNAIAAGLPAYTTIEVGTGRDGNNVNNVYPADFVTDAFSLATQRNRLEDLFCDPDVRVIQTNQGESGFLSDEMAKFEQWPQPSLTATLTVLLYRRWDAFDDVPPITLLCWELIENNGTKMKAKLVAMAEKMSLPQPFIEWLKSDDVWCPNNVQNLICVGQLAQNHEAATGDTPYVGVEPPGMFAFVIERNPNPEMNPFPEGLPGLMYCDTAEEVATIFRTKNRLLNALHVMLVARWVATSLNRDFQTVIEAMNYPGLAQWLLDLGNEIVAINGDRLTQADEFLRDVIRRFGNPWLAHKLGNICSGIPGKWEVRVKPTWDLSSEGSDSPLLTTVQRWHLGNLAAGSYDSYQPKK